jgi:hypothetical protein
MAAEARTIITQFSNDTSSSFLYGMAFIEFVALKILNEEDASQAVAEIALDKGTTLVCTTLYRLY